jgi:hypothetical protein
VCRISEEQMCVNPHLLSSYGVDRMVDLSNPVGREWPLRLRVGVER